MTNWKELFQLPTDIHYFNHAYMSPLPQTVEAAGIEGVQFKREPWKITPNHFFDGAMEVRKKFAQLLVCPAHQTAIIPSASYGLSAACSNVDANSGSHAITVAEEFPSGYYAAEAWCKKHQKTLKVIAPPPTFENRSKKWNEKLLEAIHADTAMVVVSAIHWTDGTRFDLEAIGQRCRETQTSLIIDGTQAVGAMPLDVGKIYADAVVCSAYKWLLGPYSMAMAYYGESFNDGQPLEISYLNKEGAIHFHKLVEYTDAYEKGAGRYNMGEFSQFIHVPMMSAALDLVTICDPEHIQQWSYQISDPLIKELQNNGCTIENKEGRGGHIFGVMLPGGQDPDTVIQLLRQNNFFVSRRGNALRISIHLYNTAEEAEEMASLITSCL
jgi:selenocysteine lyase/cysteine desulfurase